MSVVYFRKNRIDMMQHNLVGEAASDALEIKQPDTELNIHPVIRKRWSPRSFSEKPISEEQVRELVEAARWSPSSMNEQPWKYAYALKGKNGFEELLASLSPGNQPWAKNAAVLIVMMARTTFASSGKRNPWAIHDLGMANAQLVLQAAYRDIYAHLMGGFDSEMVRKYLKLEDHIEPVCIGALGYLGHPEQLEEPYFSRELEKRKRKPLDEILLAI